MAVGQKFKAHHTIGKEEEGCLQTTGKKKSDKSHDKHAHWPWLLKSNLAEKTNSRNDVQVGYGIQVRMQVEEGKRAEIECKTSGSNKVASRADYPTP